MRFATSRSFDWGQDRNYSELEPAGLPRTGAGFSGPGSVHTEVHSEAKRLIEALSLKPHPEGGYYCEAYRSDIQIATRAGTRDAITSIYYLLSDDMFSAFHRLKSDEIWHHHQGSPISIEIIEPDGRHRELVIGANDCWQAAVGAGVWFAARLRDPESYALVGADVAPGFDFADFEMGDRESLIAAFPQHQRLIERLTRS